jgi:hypothetical protein
MRQPKEAKAQFPAFPMISPRRSPRRIVDDSPGKVMPAITISQQFGPAKQIKTRPD